MHVRVSFMIWMVWALTVSGCEQPPPPKPATPPVHKAPNAPPPRHVPEPVRAPEPDYAKAGELQYLELVTGDADPESTLPMIVAIHGLGDDPTNFGTLLESFPEKARVILPLAPDVDEDEGGYTWMALRARDPDVEGLSAQMQASADKIAGMAQTVAKDRPTKGRPIVTGFSQGGMLTFTLAIRHEGVFSFAVPIGGWLPPPLWPQNKPARNRAHRTPIRALHGTADVAIPFEPTLEAVTHLKKKGFDIKLLEYDGVGHALVPDIRRDLYDLLTTAVRRPK